MGRASEGVNMIKSIKDISPNNSFYSVSVCKVYELHNVFLNFIKTLKVCGIKVFFIKYTRMLLFRQNSVITCSQSTHLSHKTGLQTQICLAPRQVPFPP